MHSCSAYFMQTASRQVCCAVRCGCVWCDRCVVPTGALKSEASEESPRPHMARRYQPGPQIHGGGGQHWSTILHAVCVTICTSLFRQEAINTFKSRFGTTQDEATAHVQQEQPSVGMLHYAVLLLACELMAHCVLHAGGSERDLLQTALLQMIGKPVREWQPVNFTQLMKDAGLFGLFPEKARLCAPLHPLCLSGWHSITGMASTQRSAQACNTDQAEIGSRRAPGLRGGAADRVHPVVLPRALQGAARGAGR